MTPAAVIPGSTPCKHWNILADGKDGRITATNPTSNKDKNALVTLNAAPFHGECQYLTLSQAKMSNKLVPHLLLRRKI
jgi:hypothetical protein